MEIGLTLVSFLLIKTLFTPQPNHSYLV